MRRRAIAALLCGVSFGVQAQTKSPQAFLEDIYKPYLEKDFKGQAYWEADRFFEPMLAGAMASNRKDAETRGQAPLLNVDPFVDPKELPKDWQISNLAAAATPGANGAGTGQILFVNQKTPSHLTVNLVQTPAGWRIAEIRGSSASLRTLYKLN
ncbi:MAG: DUF3828 domain-containing protein [Reyranellales bacterium]